MSKNISVELLFHFKCALCKKWWSIGDAHLFEKSTFICPYCGNAKKYEIKEQIMRLAKDPELSWRDTLVDSAFQSILHSEGSVKNKSGRHVVYDCPAGKKTIGYGRNIDPKGGLGLSDNEAHYLLRNDVKRVLYECMEHVWDFASLSKRRQVALMNMCFQLGVTAFKSFRNMLLALKIQDFETAAKEMLLSKWATQTPDRAMKLAKIIREG